MARTRKKQNVPNRDMFAPLGSCASAGTFCTKHSLYVIGRMGEIIKYPKQRRIQWRSACVDRCIASTSRDKYSRITVHRAAADMDLPIIAAAAVKSTTPS